MRPFLLLDLAYGAIVAAWIVARNLFHRPPPLSTEQRLATLPVSGLPVSAPVEIHWDEHQIPFIAAASDEDLAVALGIVHAHLRLAQIEIIRRLACGRVAEMIGPLGIEIDRALLLMDVGRAVPDIIAGLPDTTRRWAEAFLRGLNHHLMQVRPLPPEFAVLGIEPEPWTLTDLFTVARFNSADVSWLIWIRLLRVRAGMAAGDWSRLWRRLLAGGAPPGFAAATGAIAEQALAAATRSGSNSAALAGFRSAGGAAMIASDPHLPLHLPNSWLVAAVKSPSYHAVGLMIPGLPFIALGRNRWIAWGGTNLHAQGSDLFDLSALSTSTITRRSATIRVRGGSKRRLTLRESPLGPIVSDGLLLRNRTPLALRWIGHRPSDEIGAMLQVARAKDWDGFRLGLAGFAVSGLNMVFAGSDGRVGRALAAHLPRRSRVLPSDLTLAPDAAACWDRIVEGEDLPAEIDPADGVIASANQRPGGGDVPVGYFFAPDDRCRRIEAILGAAETRSAADLMRLQQDVLMPGILPLRDLLLDRLAARSRPARQQRLIDALRRWDGSYDREQEGALAFELLLAETVATLGKARQIRPYQTIWMTQSLLTEDLLALEPRLLRSALERALERAARSRARYGNWGAMHRLRLRHIFAGIPVLGRGYGGVDLPADGGNNTVNKTGHGVSRRRHAVGFGSCARHVSDLADLDANHFVLLGGQDGWVASANFADQVALWRQGRYVTVPLRPETWHARSRYLTVLQPACLSAATASTMTSAL
jgi:penicillin G amidase